MVHLIQKEWREIMTQMNLVKQEYLFLDFVKIGNKILTWTRKKNANMFKTTKVEI
jgi:hypothetical protein